MTRRDKDIQRVLDGRYDRSIDFVLLLRVLRRVGFTVRPEGSHLICSHPSVPRNLSLQPRGNLAKSYQVRQARHAILDFKLLEPDE